MARLNIVLPDELEEEFRKQVFQRYGMKKGNIGKALGEAIQDWVQKGKKRYQTRNLDSKNQ